MVTVNILLVTVNILQQKIDDKHLDSLWYDGAIATTEHFTLVATGDIRIYRNDDEDGEYLGMYDGKSRDDFGTIDDDEHIQRIHDDLDYNVDMNNWFELIGEDEYAEEMLGDTVTGNYNDALDILIAYEQTYLDEKGN